MLGFPEPRGGRQGGAASHHLSQESRGWQEAGPLMPRPCLTPEGRAQGQDKRAWGQSTSIHSSPEVLTTCATCTLVSIHWEGDRASGARPILLERDQA